MRYFDELTLAEPGFQVKTVRYPRRGSMELPVLLKSNIKIILMTMNLWNLQA